MFKSVYTKILEDESEKRDENQLINSMIDCFENGDRECFDKFVDLSIVE